jgi:hypothetical protein
VAAGINNKMPRVDRGICLKKLVGQESQQRLKDLYVSVGLFKQFILDKVFFYSFFFSLLLLQQGNTKKLNKQNNKIPDTISCTHLSCCANSYFHVSLYVNDQYKKT